MYFLGINSLDFSSLNGLLIDYYNGGWLSLSKYSKEFIEDSDDEVHSLYLLSPLVDLFQNL